MCFNVRKQESKCEASKLSLKNEAHSHSWWWVVSEMGRISVDIPDELEKQLRFKTIEEYGGRKGDLSRAVEDAIETWVAKDE